MEACRLGVVTCELVLLQLLASRPCCPHMNSVIRFALLKQLIDAQLKCAQRGIVPFSPRAQLLIRVQCFAMAREHGTNTCSGAVLLYSAT